MLLWQRGWSLSRDLGPPVAVGLQGGAPGGSGIVPKEQCVNLLAGRRFNYPPPTKELQGQDSVPFFF